MAEIIQLWEFQQARRRAERRHDEQQSLERALQLMRENLADAADDLREAPPAEQPELLNRIEQLTTMIRYGMRMLIEPQDADAAPDRGQDR
jgi:anti-sigma-K factor RskA